MICDEIGDMENKLNNKREQEKVKMSQKNT